MNDGGPAFPSHGSMGEVAQQGMSLRDYFASRADDRAWQQFHYQSDGISSVAWRWRYADAMLTERERK